ncbi:MAG: hypothetical protein Q9227_006519 [Pyrenula ochraceoflavens]
MADWVGTIVGLWDVAVRVAGFANDLRSAQDDFVGLRAEAECLLICINSLNSPSCRDTLYKYINGDQAADLDTIVKNTELNMKDLNQFISKCWRLVERKVGQNVRRSGWRGLTESLKIKVAKAWARYRFTMTDKQAFRNKLILPTQSINIYLTTLTHVGLVNVKFLIEPGGKGGNGGGDFSSDKGNGRGGPPGGTGGGQAGTWGFSNLSSADGWTAVGRRVAFKDSLFRKSQLTTDIEEEIVMYALYLIRGGAPFHANSSGAGSTNNTTRVTKTRTRSRSRSRGPRVIGRRQRSGMFLARKKSVSKPSSERVEIVEEAYQSGSDSDGHGGHRLLALPAPGSSSPGAQYVEINPRGSDSSSSSHDDFGHRRHSPSPSPPLHPSSPPPNRGPGGGLSPEAESTERRHRGNHTRLGRPHSDASREGVVPEISEYDFNARRHRVEEVIQDEADSAVQELEEKLDFTRMDRRRSRTHMRHAAHHPTREEEEIEEKEDDMDEICEILMDEYGVEVEPLPEGLRDPIYGPKVKAALPVADEEAQKRKSRDNKKARHTDRMRHELDPSENESSEKEDEKLVRDMSHGRSDLLKAETSLLGSTSFIGQNSFEKGGPLRRDRSGYDPPHRARRFAPYPIGPRHLYRPRPHYGPPPPPPFYDDDGDTWDSRSWEEDIVLERPSHNRQSRHSRYPRYGARKDSDDDSYDGLVQPMPKPRGPGPGPDNSDNKVFQQLEKEARIRRKEEKRAMEVERDLQRRSRRRPVVHRQRQSHHAEPQIIQVQNRERPFADPENPNDASPSGLQPRSRSQRYHVSGESRPQQAGMDYYMSGAQAPEIDVRR